MSDQPSYGRLVNAGGEILAEGPCWLDEPAGEVTMEPERTPGVIQKARGQLRLELDNGRLLPVSDKPMILRLRSFGGNGQERRKLYRLRLLEWSANGNHAQEAAAAGEADEGTSAPRSVGGTRFAGETPAAS